MAQTPRDDLSRRWLDKFNVDSGACRVFLGLRPDQQEALRRMGGLGQSHPSGVLMKRIRRSFGFVDLDTLMASDDLDQRSRSPALRIPSTKMNEIQGRGSLGDVISGPQPLHASTASLGAAEHTQTGVTAAEPAAAAYPSNPTVRGRDDFEHFKGSGRGSLGEPVAPLQLLNPKAAAEPVAPLQLSNAIRCGRAGKKMSPQEIDAWVRDNFREMGNAWQGNVTELARGMNCLWKGIKKGKNGGESTKYEYFNGKFHGWADGDFVIIS